MRFGQQLRSSLIKDWYYYYISYDDLKASLKTELESELTQDNPRPKRKWTEEDEKRFVRQLEQELDKVFTFQKVKSQEIVRRIKASENEVDEVIKRADQHATEDYTDITLEEDFMLLEEDLSDIIADVHDLAKFTQLNYTGFQKIIKKHDKQTDWHLKPVFAARLRAKPFFKDNYDAFIVKLSKLYDLVRTRGNPTKGDAAAGGSQQNFVRQTTKYWVHPENITELKLIILKHLPVLVFNASKEFDPKDSAISSIYYDNPETWGLYNGRLQKTEGAEAIRLRWYGGMDNDTIFVERKTHREDWTGEKSVKARFSMKEKHVNAFLAGRMTVDQIFEKARREGKKSEKEIADLEQLAREIQYRVISRELTPVTRSFYNRTAFQLPGDARVRISLDTELAMVREDNLDRRQRCGRNWRRMDIGIDYPFPQLLPEDVERFPYAILEVKLQTQAGQEPPEWIRELTASHLVEAVPKFSKFIHGTAKLHPNRIKLLPFWMPQMATDIRKPVSHRFGIERPGQSPDISTSGNIEDETDEEDNLEPLPSDRDIENENLRRLQEAREAMQQHDLDQRRDYGALNPDADDSVLAAEHNDANGASAPVNSLDVEERIAVQPLLDDDYPIYDSEDEDQDEAQQLEEARRAGGWQYHVKLGNHYFVSAGRVAWEMLKHLKPIPRPTAMPVVTPSMGVPKRTGMSARFHAPKGKRIHVPVRVEPKVFFAAERTFLSWLETCIILASIAATLLNFGDNIALASAWCFATLAIIGLIWSLGMYLWRCNRIRKRKPSRRYHDKWGPSVLCIGMVVAVIVSAGVRVGSQDKIGLKD